MSASLRQDLRQPGGQRRVDLVVVSRDAQDGAAQQDRPEREDADNGGARQATCRCYRERCDEEPDDEAAVEKTGEPKRRDVPSKGRPRNCGRHERLPRERALRPSGRERIEPYAVIRERAETRTFRESEGESERRGPHPERPEHSRTEFVAGGNHISR